VSEIQLVRQPVQIPEQDREAARRVMFGVVDGLGAKGRKAWRRFWNGLLKLEPGEIVEIRTHKERLGWYHRKHMALESRLFEAQERFESFEQFRNWIKIGAGFCDWVPGPKGAVVPIPRSIAYSKLEQGDMEQFHDDVIGFLRSPHAIKVLWPKADQNTALQAVEGLLEEFGEFGA
jgi:hypothetical protein